MPERAPSIQNSAHTNSAAQISRYRPEIDGLRAFAVIVVIINHFNKDILPGGYLGVDIFFVISGYYRYTKELARLQGFYQWVLSEGSSD